MTRTAQRAHAFGRDVDDHDGDLKTGIPGPLDAPPVVRTRGLSHRFGRTWALRDVDLEIPRGGLYVLLGPNGAGKTTLLKILLGLLHPTSGEAYIDDTPVRRLGTGHRQRIGYVAEGQELPEWMTVAQMEAYLAPLYPRWDPGLAAELRKRFRLPRTRRIRNLSRGERMKASLLAALAARPRVLILDEPFTGMDALVRDELISGLLELAQSGDWSALLCSQEVGELEGLADQVGFLDRGRLILSEPLDVLQGRFRKVAVQTPPGWLTSLEGLPPTWLNPRRAGNRVSFITCGHGAEGWMEELQAVVPAVGLPEVSPASLREIFVALASEAMGGDDRDLEGGPP